MKSITTTFFLVAATMFLNMSLSAQTEPRENENAVARELAELIKSLEDDQTLMPDVNREDLLLEMAKINQRLSEAHKSMSVQPADENLVEKEAAPAQEVTMKSVPTPTSTGNDTLASTADDGQTAVSNSTADLGRENLTPEVADHTLLRRTSVTKASMPEDIPAESSSATSLDQRLTRVEAELLTVQRKLEWLYRQVADGALAQRK